MLLSRCPRLFVALLPTPSERLGWAETASAFDFTDRRVAVAA